jgi:hypothetical protein
LARKARKKFWQPSVKLLPRTVSNGWGIGEEVWLGAVSSTRVVEDALFVPAADCAVEAV